MKLIQINRIAVIALLSLSTGGSAMANPNPAQNGYDSVVDWCNNSLEILYRYEEQAKAAYYAQRFKQSKQILLTGLEVARQLPPAWGHGRTGPITARAIQRVSQIGKAVSAAVTTRDRPVHTPAPSELPTDPTMEVPYSETISFDGGSIGDRTAIVLLFEGYEFIRNVAERLDIPYYIPYSYDPYYPNCRSHCGGVDPVEMEQAFVQMASDQIAFVQNALTGMGTPLGLPKAYLKGLEVVTAASAYDLRNSLWATQFACEIGQLSSLSSRLASYNAGSRQIYMNDQEAFYLSSAEATYLVNMIRAGESCAPYRSRGYERPRGSHRSGRRTRY